MNPASTQSHCIFILGLDARVAGSDFMIWSKLNLVALAGLKCVDKRESLGGKNCAFFGSVTEADPSIIIVQIIATEMHS